MLRLDNKYLYVGAKVYDRNEAACTARKILWLGVITLILFFPLGRSFREAGFIISAIGVFSYYLLAYSKSNLKRFGNMAWVYYVFLLFIVLKTFHSIDLISSLYVIETNWFKGFTAFFVGLEIVRSKKDLKRLVMLFSIMTFYIGLDGIYQYVTGKDFFYGRPISPLYEDSLRLTVTFIRIGDLMSMSLLIALGLPLLFSEKKPKWQRWLLFALILAPGLFLFIFAKSRSGYLGFAAGLVFLWILHRGFDWKKVCIPTAAIAAILLLGPRRVSLEQALQDPRIVDLWPFAIEVFKKWPLLGVGFTNYNPAFRSLGLVPTLENPLIPHPHNIYLEFLAESGIIGLMVLLAFFGIYVGWFLIRLSRGLKGDINKNYWRLLSVFAAAYISYLATGLGTSVTFFHAWWLGLSMFVLGVTLGGCLVGEHSDRAESTGNTSKKTGTVL